jgi:hypothetical protein
MPLIPASMIMGLGPVDNEVGRLLLPRWSSVSKVDVLGPQGKCLVTKIDENTYHRPLSQRHRAFESMFVARSLDSHSTAYLCLFHCKMNDDLNAAIQSLNVAAEDLKPVWKEKFLFIVFALRASGTSPYPTGNHPTVVVNRDRIDDYFTPTIGTAVRLQVARHLRADAK